MDNKGMEYIKGLTPMEMYEFLRECTSDFEYCPRPEYGNRAQYDGDCPRWFINGEPPKFKGPWMTPVDIPSDTCERCVKEWLGIKE